MNSLLRNTLLFFFLCICTYSVNAQSSHDVIAKVGDQNIRFHNIEVMINSSSMVGLKIPPPGTQGRNRLRLTLLDKVIDANLIYLDAKDHHAEDNQAYLHDIKRYEEATLESIYQHRYLLSTTEVSDKAVLAYYKQNVDQSQPFTKDTGTAIRAIIQKQDYKKQKQVMRKKLREGMQVEIFEDALTKAGDASRKNKQLIARFGDNKVLWGELDASFKELSDKKRIEAINRRVDKKIILAKAKQIGLEQDPDFLAITNEFKKTRLINIYRDKLLSTMEPTVNDLKQFFQKNRSRIEIKEARKIQMLVVKDREKIDDLKQKIEAGKLTFFTAASQYSIDPNAKQNLGELGWVIKGSGFPGLDKLTFSLALNQLGGPVKSPAGWHLVKVQDIRDARFQDVNDAETRKKTRRMFVKEKLNQYVIQLRKNKFPVKVYEQVLKDLMEKELQAT